jgi:hypothetical protein
LYEVDVESTSDSGSTISVKGREIINNDHVLRGKFSQPKWKDISKSMCPVYGKPQAKTPKNVWAIPYFKRKQYEVDVKYGKGRMQML